MVSSSGLDTETLRRELTRTLAEAIAQASAAPESDLRSQYEAWDALLQAARRVASRQALPQTPRRTARPSVLVVDPEPVREWNVAEYDLVDVSRDALQGLAHAQELRPDAIIYNLPAYSFADVSAIAELAAVGIALQVIVLTDDEADRRRLATVRRPRLTVLPRESDRATIAATLGVAMAEPGQPQAAETEPDGLTSRELEVLHLMAAGKANKQIAADLGVSIATAKYHVANILRKLDAANRAQALVHAYEAGMLLR